MFGIASVITKCNSWIFGRNIKFSGLHIFSLFYPYGRPPVYDIRELQALELMDHEGLNGSGPNNLDKERNMVNDDPKWQGELHCYPAVMTTSQKFLFLFHWYHFLEQLHSFVLCFPLFCFFTHCVCWVSSWGMMFSPSPFWHRDVLIVAPHVDIPGAHLWYVFP